ncbi:class E sortase [Streptomyces cavernae]|uniref:class E sortase n=1 Tax=Streptomyces cavernae TaxID=2259034 RepID=UPI001EE45A3F|nr:class E sortase [Streptomyces cavernae]
MTALRPERESGYQEPGSDGTPYEQRPYGVSGSFQVPGAPGAPGPAGAPGASGAQRAPGAFEAAADGIVESLTAPTGPDGLSSVRGTGPIPRYEGGAQHAYAEPRATQDENPPVYGRPGRPQYENLQQPLPGPRSGDGYPTDVAHASRPSMSAYQLPDSTPAHGIQEPDLPPIDEETVSLRIAGSPLEAFQEGLGEGESITSQGGRAARRKAARRHGRHGGAHETVAGAEAFSGTVAPPGSRMEARRAARAQKPSAGVVVSRAIGEVFITTGVLMLLFVGYQLWWTNYRAHQQAGTEANNLQQDWASGKRAPGAFEPGQGFAIMDIPKLDVVVPIAEGIDKKRVLDRGMVGHYGEDSIPTAMPDAKTGNFAVAGHRNTHGEPFRYINKLQPGDPIVVETQDTYYVYEMTSVLPVTSPKNTSVLDPIPKGSGFTGPGRYITLTTCTPEFTSKYRLIVWGKMVEERPRSKGKPDALIR